MPAIPGGGRGGGPARPPRAGRPSPGVLPPHAHTRDAHSAECRRFLAGLESGSLHARLEPLVLHGLSYALRHYLRQLSRAEIAAYLLMVLAWDGIEAEKDLLIEVVQRWSATP